MKFKINDIVTKKGLKKLAKVIDTSHDYLRVKLPSGSSWYYTTWYKKGVKKVKL